MPQDKINCHYYDSDQCRSCSLLNLPLTEIYQNKTKAFTELVHSTLGKDTPIAPLVKNSIVFPSRSKAKLSVSGSLAQPMIGLMDNQSFEALELLDCPLHYPEINQVLHTVKELISLYKLVPYNIPNQTGELKGLILKSNAKRSEMILRFIFRSTEPLTRMHKVVSALQERHPSLKVISSNIQSIPHAILEGPEEHIHSVTHEIWESYHGFKVAYGPQSFSQVTHESAKALYEKVSHWVKQVGAKNLLELYCGSGAFSLACAPHTKRSLGIELSKDAIRCAKLGAKENGYTHLSFESHDIDKGEGFNFPAPIDLVIVNPPKRGLQNSVIKTILQLHPKNIIYSSCNPPSLLRDLASLKGHYQVTQLVPFDMFPLTRHIEMIALLQQNPI